MHKTKKTFFIGTLIIAMITSQAHAAEANLFSNLDYPELQVSPRASERLEQLALMENDQGLMMHWTMISSGAATLIAGYKHRGVYKDNITDKQKKDSDLAGQTAIGIGAAWVGIGTYFNYKQFATNKLKQLKKYSGADKKSELSKERFAEEGLAFASDNIKTLKYLSVISNFAAACYIGNNSPSEKQTYVSIAAGLSFLPLLFDNPYEVAWEKQQEYKKKIYAPLVSWNLNSEFKPELNLLWTF